MDHLHWEFDATPRDTLEITVDQMANVLLMDDANYKKYSDDQQHAAFGGMVEKSPLTLKPYRAGKWHIAVDMGRSGGKVTASVKNRTTGQPIGQPQSRQLTGVRMGTMEFRADKHL
jgi:hypothetical protein